jgi:hypothetical protein
MPEWEPWAQRISAGAGAVAAVAALYRNRGTAAVMLRFSRYPARYIDSVRTSEVRDIAKALEALEYGKERFILLYGPKGVGKTTALSTGLGKLRGVIHVDVQRKMTASEIINVVHKKIWFYTYAGSMTKEVQVAAQNVINTYNRIWGPPVVVLDLVNKQESTLGPDALGAARTLSRNGVKVIIDASEGTLDADSDGFSRARSIYVDYMDWVQIQKIPEFEQLLRTLEKHQLTAQVQEVIGGCPGQLENLQAFLGNETSPEKTKEKIKTFLIHRIGVALKKRIAFTSAAPAVKDVLKLFQTQDTVPIASFEGIELPANSSQVLRFRDEVYVARTPAMGFVLKHDITDTVQLRKFGL